jgi:hypothetical protein
VLEGEYELGIDDQPTQLFKAGAVTLVEEMFAADMEQLAAGDLVSAQANGC